MAGTRVDPRSPIPSARDVVARLRAFAGLVAFAFAFRFACYAAMTALALWNERRPAPTLPDVILGTLPYLPWVDRVNYVAWLVTYVPIAIALLIVEPARWVRYMITGGFVSLARGVCIALTGLGVPDPAHAGNGLGNESFASAYGQLLSPFDVFGRGAARVFLTKDLFFSGHTATTFLLLLYVWHRPRLRALAALAHVSAVASVLFAHLHYSLDIIGAWAFTFAIFALREWRPQPVHA